MSRFQKAKAFFYELPSRSCSTPPSPKTMDITKENTERIFQLLKDGCLEREDLQFIQTLLGRIPRGENLQDVVGDKGWNLLQKAVICNQPQVVSMLIARNFDLNLGACSLPLHLACKLGHAQIVQMLLDSGAKADLSRGLCYPVPHYMKPGNGKPPKFRCRRIRIPATPLGYAIPNDRDEVVRMLLTHRNSRDIVKKDLLLHEACKYRAKRCLKLLVDLLPDQVNTRDKKGLTPLQHALHGPKNRESAIILLESNAQFAADIFETEYGTLLHELYVSDDSSYLLQLTQLMLQKGPPDLAVSISKTDGDTLLHKLLKHFGSTTPRDKEQYVNEVQECMILLMKHRCDPNQPNKKGETALHALLSHHSGRPLFYIRDRFGVGPAYLSSLLGYMQMLMQVLLANKSDPNLMLPPNVVSPLYYLMRVVCAMSPHLLSATAPQVKACLQVLLAYGCNPNAINAFGDNSMTLLLGSLSRWLYHTTDDSNKLEVLLSFTKEVLFLFLSHGLDPRNVLRKNLKQFVIIFNSTILDNAFITHLNDLLRCVIRAGGNPNLININELHSGVGVPHSYATKYTVGYYLARGLYIHAQYHNDSAFQILEVFRNTLAQSLLSKCVEGICANLMEEFEQGVHSEFIQRQVRSLSDHPRTLKQLCRIQIYQAINWQIRSKCDLLPLPLALITYLRAIE